MSHSYRRLFLRAVKVYSLMSLITEKSGAALVLHDKYKLLLLSHIYKNDWILKPPPFICDEPTKWTRWWSGTQIYTSANEDVLFTRAALVSAHWEPPAEKKMTPSCLCSHISLKHCHIRSSVLLSEGMAATADDPESLCTYLVARCVKWIQATLPGIHLHGFFL